MKAEIIKDFTPEQIRDYWNGINAPIVLRVCPSKPNVYSIYKKPTADIDSARAFLLASTKFDTLTRAKLAYKTGVNLPEIMPAVVLSRIWGKVI